MSFWLLRGGGGGGGGVFTLHQDKINKINRFSKFQTPENRQKRQVNIILKIDFFQLKGLNQNSKK